MILSRKRNMGGFTLIEMAIVIVLIGLMLGGVVMTIGVQQRQQHVRDAERQLDEIKLALIGYAASRPGKPHLPCPAISVVNGNEGPRNGAGQCTVAEGALPWVTLGVGELDPWGSRYRYRVAAAYGNSNGFMLGSLRDIEVCRTAACASNDQIAINVPAVVITHGANKRGAFLPTGGTAPVSGNASEAENSNQNTRFVSGAVADDYDDLVMWLSPYVLNYHMLQTRLLP